MNKLQEEDAHSPPQSIDNGRQTESGIRTYKVDIQDKFMIENQKIIMTITGGRGYVNRFTVWLLWNTYAVKGK